MNEDNDSDVTPTEDLNQFTGAEAHPSEPVTRPADTARDPSKIDPETQ